jgi:poly-gamma-glutamate capsule biosynthesis protein CapA/YwtB (metallophosphatase superfamily)
VRVIAAEFFVNNSFGAGQSAELSYAGLPLNSTIRTLSGVQFSLQVNGYLATQQNAAPPLIVEASHAIRDMRATVNQAANGYDIVVQVMQNGEDYGSALTISTGATTSTSIIEGADLPPLVVGALLTIDITLNIVTGGSAAVLSPGRDLTVTIRL